MSLSMYQASIPVFIRALNVLTTLLQKGAQHAKEQGLPPESLLEARLAPDMFNLVEQVQRASDTSKGSAERLSGVPAPRMPDTEKTFEELSQRVAKTVDYLESLDPARFEGSETRTVLLPVGGDTRLEFQGDDYLLSFGLPNFYFHVTTAYDILRHRGVQVGKRDFLGVIGKRLAVGA
ncbi:hypothetical protein MYSTI_01179 [Myxococcus stipitatus DSM 14675]|uniref:DUF1993 domain-containing protein n=1 Tax=Myxococcus stipitatus (strain DSM 14675 / JCM 12634 / Mx s8) TaxID=1278073 RepID=L7U4Q6_MYXSD|nr:DUF1993 domain-containing protein [Myxococcus stipitatus]AGC42527.1 hypothetical protein MYSTI_01179 [Myxococcus stipitatus DSM 14675]